MSVKRVPLKGSARSLYRFLHEAIENKQEEVPKRRRASIVARKRAPDPGARLREAGCTCSPADGGQCLDVTVLLRHRPASGGLPSFEEIGSRTLAERRPMSHDEFASTYGAEAEEAARFEEFARQHGLEVTAVDTAQRRVELRGTVSELDEAFGIELNAYRVGDESFMGYRDDIRLPPEIEEVVETVIGLDTYPIGQCQSSGGPGDLPQTREVKLPEFLPPQIAEFYDFPDYDGTGECIGIIALGGGYDETVLQSYFDYLKIPMPEITSVDAGASNDYNTDDGDTQEIMLDLEVSGALVPGAKHVVYFGNNEWVRPIQAALNDTTNNPSVLSVSFSSPEVLMTETEMIALDGLFKEAALKGVTICVASGDTGSSISSVHPTLGFVNDLTIANYPTSNPGALGVGGTVITAIGDRLVSEEVWNYLGIVFAPEYVPKHPPENLGATGGGQSLIYELPAYQKHARVAYATNNRNAAEKEAVQKALGSPAPVPEFGRGLPDVAANAMAYKTLVSGTAPEDFEPVGGTSASTPVWASLVIRMNQALGRRLGFLNPTLYNDVRGVFRQMTWGTNGAYDARPELKWNACTGLGVPNGKKLLRQLKRLSK